MGFHLVAEGDSVREILEEKRRLSGKELLMIVY